MWQGSAAIAGAARNGHYFHAFYGDEEVLIDIRRLIAFSGHLSPRALG